MKVVRLRSSHQRWVFYKKRCSLKISQNHRKAPMSQLFLNTFPGLRPLLKKRLQRSNADVSCEFCEIFKNTLFYKEHCGGCFLSLPTRNQYSHSPWKKGLPIWFLKTKYVALWKFVLFGKKVRFLTTKYKIYWGSHKEIPKIII